MFDVFGQPLLEGRDDAAGLAGAAVFGRQHQLDVELAKEIQAEEFLRPTRAVKQCRLHTASVKRFGQHGEGRKTDAAGDHPGFRRRIDKRERAAERAEDGHPLSGLSGVNVRRGDADAFVQQR